MFGLRCYVPYDYYYYTGTNYPRVIYRRYSCSYSIIQYYAGTELTCGRSTV